MEEDKIQAALIRLGRLEADEKLAREIGEKIDADYVVVGSVTKVNGSMSLDARILDMHQPKIMTSVFAAGRGGGAGNHCQQVEQGTQYQNIEERNHCQGYDRRKYRY